MLVISFTSLILNIRDRVVLLISGNQNFGELWMQISIAGLLLVLGVLLVISCGRKLLEKDGEIEYISN
jgi:hypothetical protein